MKNVENAIEIALAKAIMHWRIGLQGFFVMRIHVAEQGQEAIDFLK